MTPLTTKATEIRAGLGPVPVIETFAINPVGEGDIVVEGGTRFAHERDLAALIEWAKKAAALIEQQAAELAEQHLRHETGERITRKDLNNAYRSGQENGRLFAETVENRLIGERAEEDLAAEASLDMWRTRAVSAEAQVKACGEHFKAAESERERLGAELAAARAVMRNAWGAVTSGQVVDKQVDKMLRKGIEAADAAAAIRAPSALENGPAGLADAHSKSPAHSSQSERIAVLEAALGKVKHWAESRCPCHNEQPNPCPLCGASVENLEACKSAESTLPRDVLEAIRKASPRSALAPLGEE